ncbi:ANTAR domain-containing protein [Arthrobacter sp. YAF16]
MAQNRRTKAGAFKILVRASNSRNIKLKDLAAQVIDSISGEQRVTTHFDD